MQFYVLYRLTGYSQLKYRMTKLQVKAAELKQQYKTSKLDLILSHVDAVYAIFTTCFNSSFLILSSHIPDLPPGRYPRDIPPKILNTFLYVLTYLNN